MIAMVGLEKFKLKKFDKLDYPAKPRWPLDENFKGAVNSVNLTIKEIFI